MTRATILCGLRSIGSGSCRGRFEREKQLFEEISPRHGFEIKELEVAKDHVHVFVEFPPKDSIAKVVGTLDEYEIWINLRFGPIANQENGNPRFT